MKVFPETFADLQDLDLSIRHGEGILPDYVYGIEKQSEDKSKLDNLKNYIEFGDNQEYSEKEIEKFRQKKPISASMLPELEGRTKLLE